VPETTDDGLIIIPDPSRKAQDDRREKENLSRKECNQGKGKTEQYVTLLFPQYPNPPGHLLK
jgi:hypothetical protein